MKARFLLVAAILASLALVQCSMAAGAAGVTLKPKTPEQLEASHSLIEGSLLLKAKQPFKARPLLEHAAALWPDEAHVHFNLASCYSEMGDFPRAIGEYEETLKLDPTINEALVQMATCYQFMGQYSQAIALFKQYLHKNPHGDDQTQIEGMIAALNRQASKQVDSDPQAGDYLPSVARNGRLERWQYNRLPLKIFISNGGDDHGMPVSGFREYFNDILVQAIDKWIKASNYRLAYTLVPDARNADIVCTWTDRKDFLQAESTNVEQGAARVSTQPLPYTTDQSQIRVARVIILICNPNSGLILSDEDMKKTCLHEIGHALGLSGHSNNNKDVMFYSESPTVWAALTKRDENTIARLYGDYPIFSWSRNLQPAQQASLQYQPTAQYAPRLPAAPTYPQEATSPQSYPYSYSSPPLQPGMGQPFPNAQPYQQR